MFSISPNKLSSDPNDAADREAFERGLRLIRQDRYGDYIGPNEKETRFQYFKNYLRTEVTQEMRDHGYNLIHLADRSEQELDDLTFHSFAFCHVSNELLDDLEEISSRPKDDESSCC
ncbi:hypothetical protein P8452_58605 [Trifolium repens]|nr:hypothetical protein P8452_58605 [Trifolium repens]